MYGVYALRAFPCETWAIHQSATMSHSKGPLLQHSQGLGTARPRNAGFIRLLDPNLGRIANMLLTLFFLMHTHAADLLPDEPTVELPAPGAHQLRVLSSTILELTLVTT